MAESPTRSQGGARWELTRAERDEIRGTGRFRVGDLFRALLSRPSLIPSALRTGARGARQGIREDPELGWYLYTRRLQRHFPDAATGAGWYGEQGFMAALDPYLDPAARVLDVGCGAGRLLRLVAPKVGEAVGCDLSRPMLDEAAKNLADLENVTLLHAGLGELEDQAPFDVTFAHDVLVNIDPDPSLAMLDLMRRRLREGGVCVASFFTVDEDSWARAHMEMIRTSGHAGHFGVGHPRPYVSSQVDAMMRMAGFELVQAKYGEEGPDQSRPHYIVVGKVPAAPAEPA
jgi:SAM-dependent methyltransferase